MKLTSIPALQDNYIWILNNDDGYCLIVDPGEAEPVLNVIQKNKWNPEIIFLTHHHNDHTGGVLELCSYFPHIVVYGPVEALHSGVKKIVHDGDLISLPNCEFSVFETPGHTLGHLCFFSFPYLFCGDTLFSGGCGRIFEGTPKQMYQSIQKINQLPEDTIICCAHEYTLENMKFAVSIAPNDFCIKKYYQKVQNLIENKQTTLPVILKSEKRINLFLRNNNDCYINNQYEKTKFQCNEEYFTWLRSKRDDF